MFQRVLKDARSTVVAAAADKDQYIDPDAAKVRIRIVAGSTQGQQLPKPSSVS